jgi:hypothetical protein
MLQEVDLINSMEDTETRHLGHYCDSLEELLDEKGRAVENMLIELSKYLYVRESDK